MKELTIEQKAEAYDEAIINGSRLWECGEITRENYEYIFPELKESEDKRIRKAIHIGSKNAQGKLGEMIKNLKPVNEVLEHKPADKVEPKFKVGDKIRRKAPHQYDKDMQVSRIESNYYLCNHLGKFSSESISFSEESNYELVEQNHTCSESEEDEKMIRVLMSICDEWATRHSYLPKEDNNIEEIKNWLKSLRPQNRWKPSDEQMEALDNALSLAKNCGEESAFDLRILYEQLKKQMALGLR